MNDRYKLDMFHQSEESFDDHYAAREITEDVYKVESLVICLLAMDLPAKSIKYRKELENKWISLLPLLENVKRLSIRIRVNQLFFDAVCEMKNLESLHFWTSTVEDISSISKLSNLKRLYMDNFSRLTDISPLMELKQLNMLSISNCFKIENYEMIGGMQELIALRLQGDKMAPRNLRIKSLKPFQHLKKLRHLDISSVSVVDNSYDIIISMGSLERFDTTSNISKPIRNIIKTHPKLKAGFFVDWDWEHKRFYEGKDWTV